MTVQPDGRSLWYAIRARERREQIGIVAATGPSGVCSIMCTGCGHTFVDGKPLTDESDVIGNIVLATALYFHSCEDESHDRKPR